MYVFSAPEAISPALNRTRDFLFRPFRWGTFLKLCAVGVITEGLWNSSNGSHRGGATASGGGHSLPFNIPPGTLAAVVAIGVVALALAVVLFYVIVRLRFTLFHCLVFRVRELTPGWRLYREQAMRFFLLNIVVGIGFLAIALVALAPFFPGLLNAFHQSQAAGRIDLGRVLPLILQLIPVLMALALLGVAADVVLRDFMLPHMALENASAGEAWSAAIERVGSQKGAFLLYAVLRLLLPFVAMIGIFVVLILPIIVVFGIPGVMMAGLQAFLMKATGAAWLVALLLEIALGVFMFALAVLIAITVGGPLSIAVRNYALLFYGGRYRVLGDILSPPQTAPAAPPLPA